MYQKLLYTVIASLLFHTTHCVAATYKAKYQSSHMDHSMDSMEHDNMVNFTIAYTLWYPNQEGLAVSYDTTYRASPCDKEEDTSTVTYPSVDPRSGFKVGASYLFDNNHCDISFSYTWFYNQNNDYTRVEPPASASNTMNTIYATWRIDGDNNQFIKGLQSSVWNNSFNRFDFTIGRNFLTNRSLSLHCFAGLIFAWDDQTFKLSYVYDNSDNSNMIAEWCNTQDWYSIGPYIGLSPCFTFWMSNDCDQMLSLYGKSGFALGWSEANSRMQRGVMVLSTSTEPTPDSDYREIFNYVSPMIDLSLGLHWQSYLGDQWSLMGAIDWDLQVWFDHNQMFSIEQYPPSGGSYSMQGLTLAFGVGI